MVGQAAPALCRRLQLRLARLCGGLVIVFGLLALPSLAAADELPVCPVGALEIAEAMPQPEREVRALRNDSAESCRAQAARIDVLAAKLAVLVESDGELLAAIRQLHDDLSAEAGLPVRVAGQQGPLQVDAPEGVEVTNEPVDFSSLEQATMQGNETSNQNLWALAGMVAGSLFLVVLYKLVRP